MSGEQKDTPKGAHTMGGDGEPAQPQRRLVSNFALGIFKDDKDGHIFLGMLPVVNGEIIQAKPYRFTKSADETLEFFERFKEILEGGKKRPAYLG